MVSKATVSWKTIGNKALTLFYQIMTNLKYFGQEEDGSDTVDGNVKAMHAK